MKSLFCLFIAMSLGGGAFAAQTPLAKAPPKQTPFIAQNYERVSESRLFKSLSTVPSWVKQIIPPRGKTKFYGEVDIPESKASLSLRVHFYEWSFEKAENQQQKGQCRIDIFVKESARDTFHLVASSGPDAKGIDSCFEFPTQFVELFWFDPQSKRIPMVRLSCQVMSGFYGPLGRNVILTFHNEFSSPSVQTFENYSSHFDFVDWNFDGRDDKGQRQFTQLIDPLGVDEEGNSYTPWSWNGSQFAPPPPVNNP